MGDPSEEGDDDSNKKKEPFYLKDPKRALTAFFEREGAELIYDVEDHQFGSYRCTIKLPIIDEYGRAIQAECEQKHCKRKEIIHECVLEACRILDQHDVLREGTSASSINTTTSTATIDNNTTSTSSQMRIVSQMSMNGVKRLVITDGKRFFLVSSYLSKNFTVSIIFSLLKLFR